MTLLGRATGPSTNGNSGRDAARAKEEAEKKALEAAKSECRSVLEQMRHADPATAEKIKMHINEMVKAYTKLPMDFKADLQKTAKRYECNANMRATDLMLNKALAMAMHHDTAERAKLLNKGREYHRKAMMLGADKEFGIAAERTITAIAQTSAPDLTRATKAKPLSSAPKNPHSAKM